MDAVRLEIPGCLKSELQSDESVLWTGRPPLRLLRRFHFVAIPIGLAMIVFGWLMVIQFRPSITGRRESDLLVSHALIGVGSFVAFYDPWRNWRRRRRSFYVLTDRRALICEEGKLFAQYFLNGRLETSLSWHGTGAASIAFGPSGPKAKFPPDDPDVSFVELPDAAAVLDRIHVLCGKSPQELNAGKIIPFVKRVDPEDEYDSAAPAQNHPLEYALPVRQKLLTNEKLLFVARPPQAWVFRSQDWVVMPFAAIWTLFSLTFAYRGLRFGCPGIVALGFAYLGYYMLIGRFIQDRRERRRMWYSVTDRRALIVTDGKIIETRSVYWNFLQGSVRKMQDDGTASLTFVLNALGRSEVPSDDGITAIRRPLGVQFERIDDPQTVERLVMQHVTILEHS